MNIENVKSAWRRWNKPSRKTMQALEQSGTRVDYWPDYSPTCSHGPAGRQQSPPSYPLQLTAPMGRKVA